MNVKPIPENYHTITPYLVVKETNKLIAFLETVFDTKATICHQDDEGQAQHAEVKVGDSIVMIGAAQHPDQTTNSMLYLYVEDTDAYYKKALAAGATSVMEPANQFYGDRNAGVKDSFGNQWWFATRVEHVSPEELKKRAEATCKTK